MITYTPDNRARIRTAQPSASPSGSGSGSFQTLSELNVANPEESDVDFVIHAFDSALPYLASIGSEAQWGTVLFSEKPKVRQSFDDYVRKSYDLNSTSQDTPPSDGQSWQHLALYEVQTEQAKWRRVAAQGLSTSFPNYVPDELARNELKEATNYLYLNYLIADRRTGDLAKGAASQLVAFGINEGKARGKSVFYGDCWRGNNDGLIKYYQRLGFEPVGPFEVKDKHGPSLNWTGYLFSRSLRD
ncbi:uncharacterized protein UTRI_02207_B [Ustilago trichophora]|uniref:N-acetyltransferase domain-containing protein n=1 Tax=Ustilago trichophora TaxID=86804 RepID=A0A5C3DXX9_9BASI|nr:uncharacterized protein UTRI_02207_B [Ustilago trichophora]